MQGRLLECFLDLTQDVFHLPLQCLQHSVIGCFQGGWSVRISQSFVSLIVDRIVVVAQLQVMSRESS